MNFVSFVSNVVNYPPRQGAGVGVLTSGLVLNRGFEAFLLDCVRRRTFPSRVASPHFPVIRVEESSASVRAW